MTEDLTHGHAPSGVERIAALEVRIAALVVRVEETHNTAEAIKSLMLQGRGAVRLIQWAAGLIAALGAGWLGHAKIEAFLKWMGS